MLRVFAPATVANVGPGFDIFGFALDRPGDVVVLKKSSEKGLVIKAISGDQGRLPYDVMKNTAGVAILSFLEAIDSDQGFIIELHKDMPLGSGLGSSAASAVAGVFAANHLLGQPLSCEELLPFAMEGERIACGTAHADNVAPSLMGGFVLIRSYDPLDVVRIPTPKDLYCSVVYPDIEIRTEDSRNILPKNFPLSKGVCQWGNTAGLIAGMILEDYSLISRSLEDFLIEKYRSKLIPHFEEVKSKALENGALACSISGSGPSLFALSKGRDIAEMVAQEMQAVFINNGCQALKYVSAVNHQGPKIIEEA